MPPMKSSVTVSAPPPVPMVMLVTSAKRKRLTQAGALLLSVSKRFGRALVRLRHLLDGGRQAGPPE